LWGAILRKSSLINIFFVPIVAFGLAGCDQLTLRKGPPPVLDATAVQTAANNQNAIIYALAQDAGYNPQLGGIDYYQVTLAGFNYVDDQCTAYFDQLYFIDRERGQLKSGLAAASGTTAAILGVTNASTLTMSVVASAFGFASAATDILAGTYLYSLPPATTLGLVNKLQIAYRDAAARARADINTPTAAYHQIQSYLALCLPPTIETAVANQVNAATAVGVPVAGGSIAVVTGSTLPPKSSIPPSRAALAAPISKPQQRAPKRPEPKVINETGRSQFEQFRLFKDTIMNYEGALCVTEDGNVSSLRAAAATFFRAGNKNDVADRIERQGLLDVDTGTLDKLVRQNPNCKTKLNGPAAVGKDFFGE
jgi:hypothetical protein